MQDNVMTRMYASLFDELEKISTVIRISKGGKRHVSRSKRREHVKEEGYDPKALFQATEGSEEARAQAMRRREEGAGKPAVIARLSGVSGEKEMKTPFQKRQAEKKKKKEKEKAKK